MANPKQESNLTGLAIAEEQSIKVLPAAPVWYTQEPNSYSDFGSELTLVARSTINASRQQQKGGIVDLDASGGFNQDFTQTNFQRLLQGFMFADARQKATSNPLTTSRNLVEAIEDGAIVFADALNKPVLSGSLLIFKGFDSPLNNGLKAATAAGTNDVAVAGLVDDAAPANGATVAVCGHRFAAADIALTYPANVPTMVATAFDFTTLGLTPGEWIFLGGDSAVSSFEENRGYARVKSISAKAIIFDKISWPAFTAKPGAGKSIEIYFGTVIRNEKDAQLIKRRSYHIERQLGRDDNGIQAEYLQGAVPNELTLNVPQAEKLNADITFVAVDNLQRNGQQGLLAGGRVNAPGEPLYNTSSNVVRFRMSVVDNANPNPSPLFSYLTEGTFTINNGITPDKAIGVLGAFDTSADDFVVGGEVTAYFSTVEAVRAVRNNADVTVDMIFAAANAGWVIDIPLLALGGGRLNVEKGVAIQLPLEMSGAENDKGYTLMLCFFDYLPNVAMPL